MSNCIVDIKIIFYSVENDISLLFDPTQMAAILDSCAILKISLANTLCDLEKIAAIRFY